MKRILLSLLLLAGCGALFADVPAGTTIYLNTAQYGGGHSCYYIWLSRDNKGYLMTEVVGQPGVYSYVCPSSTQDNIRFVYRDGGTNCASTVSQEGTKLTNDDVRIPNSTNTYYRITGPAWNGGTWEPLPLDGQVTNVSAKITDIKCVDSTYVVTLTVALSGTANLKISGNLLANEKKIAKCESGYETTVRVKWTAGATQHSVTVSAYSDGAYTSLNNSQTINVLQPTLECEITTGEIEVCSDKAKDIELKAENSGDSIQWYDGNGTALGHTQSIKVSPKAPKEVYTAKVYESYINPDNNLMVNGDFESGYSGFQSDPNLSPITKNGVEVLNPYHVYSGNYDNGSNYGHYYMITNNAADIQDGVSCTFAPIVAHGGDEFLLVDASNKGYAWYTTTAQSPNLILKKGENYLFSYWVACPNTEPELSRDPKAVLQFIIELNVNGKKKTEKLSTYKVGTDSPVDGWHYQEVRWQCPVDCNDVMIGVMDTVSSTAGNDFCLDDIIFQPITKASKKESMVEHHPVVVKDCEEKCPDVKIILHDTVVCDTMMPIKWRGRQYDGPKVYRDTIRSKENAACCDSIIIDSLVTERCGDCEYIVYAKWDDVLFVNNGPTGLNGKAMTYAWYCDGKLIPDANAQSYYNPGGMEGHVFKAEVMLKDSSIVTSCEFAFDTFERSADANPGIDPRKPVVVQVYQVFGRMKVIRRRYDDGTVETEKVWELY